MKPSSTMPGVFVDKRGICESRSIGPGTRVWAFAHVLSGARIGRDCNICDHVFIENDVILGDEVTVKSGVQLWDGSAWAIAFSSVLTPLSPMIHSLDRSSGRSVSPKRSWKRTHRSALTPRFAGTENWPGGDGWRRRSGNQKRARSCARNRQSCYHHRVSSDANYERRR